jgi:hypothetical protein
MREDFSAATKETIAGRAGYQCSVPYCRRTTIGPGASAAETASVGVAAHIYGASPGGPRGSGQLASEELRHPSNGIWLCADHARLVDTNEGKAFPPSLLISWKGLAEAAATAGRDRSGHHSFCWLHRMKILDSTVLVAGSELRFGKVTLLRGANGTGKTSLLQWIAGTFDSTHLAKWMSARSDRDHVVFDLEVFVPEQQRIAVRLQAERAEYFLDAVPVAATPIPMAVVFLSSERMERNDEDDVTVVARALNVAPLRVANVVHNLGVVVDGYVAKAQCLGPIGQSRLMLSLRGSSRFASIFGHSAGERECALIEIAMALAESYSRHSPTLLLIDYGRAPLDDERLDRYANALQDDRYPFQTIFAWADQTDGVKWSGWESISLCGYPPDTRVSQD